MLWIEKTFLNSKKFSLIQINRLVYINGKCFESKKIYSIQRNFFLWPYIQRNCFLGENLGMSNESIFFKFKSWVDSPIYIQYRSELWDQLFFDNFLNYLHFNSVSDEICTLNNVKAIKIIFIITLEWSRFVKFWRNYCKKSPNFNVFLNFN